MVSVCENPFVLKINRKTMLKKAVKKQYVFPALILIVLNTKRAEPIGTALVKSEEY